jgi:hypothetical protein
MCTFNTSGTGKPACVRTPVMQVHTPTPRQDWVFHRHQGATTPVTYPEVHVSIYPSAKTFNGRIFDPWNLGFGIVVHELDTGT